MRLSQELRGKLDATRRHPRDKKEPRNLLLELEVQYQYYGDNKNSNDEANDPFVPVHSFGHCSQNSLAPPNIVIHSMKLAKKKERKKLLETSWYQVSLSTHSQTSFRKLRAKAGMSLQYGMNSIKSGHPVGFSEVAFTNRVMGMQ